MLTAADRALLTSSRKPIVLLPRREAAPVSGAVAPGNTRLGVMLPYTPPHRLLFDGAAYEALVMTSGNLTEEPIVSRNEEAWPRLKALADYFLLHNREIQTRVDDSVVQSFEGREYPVRRSRGFAPGPVDLGMQVREVLACGGELKNTFCLTKEHYAIPSQHIGDLENLEAMAFFRETLGHLKRFFRVSPEAVAHDLHPNYLSTRFALEESNLRPIGVQHHHAHIASCVADNGIQGRVIGVAFDGTGYGTDSQIWGGEFLVCDFGEFERCGHLAYIPLAGGDSVVRQPWRSAVAYLDSAFGAQAKPTLTGEPFSAIANILLYSVLRTNSAANRVAIVVAILTITARLSFGQMNVAEIGGMITDPSGDVISGAMVIATNTATGVLLTAISNSTGQYLLPNLVPGTYDVVSSATGFKLALQANVLLHAGQTMNLNFSMVLGERTETLVVEELPGLLQTESAQIRDVIETQQVNDLPVKDREFLELAMLGTGVVNPPGGTRGDALQQTGLLINILGQRTGHNLFMVDGVSVTDEYFNNVVLNPPPDAILEFNIDKTDYDAEFGGKSGGVINVITRSGTNIFHGTAYEYLRNSVFDARNFFAPPGQPTPFQENQFGGTFGGPIRKNRTFFFLNYGGQRIRDSVAQLFSVPTAAERSGVFPTTVVNPLGGVSFPGNTIDVPINPAAAAMLAKVPLPNLPGAANNLLAIDPRRIDNNEGDARLDHQFSSKDSGYARFSLFNASEFDPFGSSVLNEALLPGFGRNLTTNSRNASAGEVHIFSPSIQNEFRFGYLRVYGGQGDPNAGTPFAAQYGLEGTTPNPADTGYPQISLSNEFTTMGSATGFTTRTDTNFELFDNVSIQHGAHAIKFGGYFFHLDFNPSYPNDARGLYTFNGAYSGNPLADFLLGYPSQAQVGIGEGAENAHTNWAHFYVEDKWKATQRLTLDLGVRYEFNENLYAQANQTSNIDLLAPGGPAFVVAGNPAALPPAAAALAALSPIPVTSAASQGWNNSLLTPKSVRLSPRVGLAWQLPRLQQTVFRAGFGIYTNQAAYSVLQNLAENAPFYLLKTVANGANPEYTMQNILSFNPTGGTGANGVNHNFAIEYNEVWNAALQKQLTGDTSLEIDYIGSRTVHADSSTVENVPSVFGGPRPYPQLASFSSIRWDGWATFNALDLRYSHRFSHGLSLESSYMWSKSLDDASDTGTTNAEYNLPQDPFAMALEKGLSSFDHRQRFTADTVYDLPFGNHASGWRHLLTGSWRISEILIAQSGPPFTVNLSSAAAENVSPIGLVNGNNLERPNLIGNPNGGPQTPAEWFNIAAFAVPLPGTYGTAGRNIVMGPGLIDFDVSLQKEAKLFERLKLQFRVDAYNALNHPNFNIPGRIYGASNFGVITSAADPRQMQLAIKLLF